MILKTNSILNKCYLAMLDFVLCFVSNEKHKISTVLVGIRTLIFARVFLSVVLCFTTDSRNGRGMTCRTTAFTAFAEYLILNNNKNGHLICSYFTAVRWNLVQSGINIDFLKDLLIKSGRAALEKLNRLNKSLKEKRFPATAEFVATLSNDLMSLGTYEGFSMSVGAMLGFTCMLRVHEYLHDAPRNMEVDLDEPDDYHTIRTRDVLFEFHSKDILGHECSTFVPPVEVHLHSIDNLVAMDFIVPSSKMIRKAMAFLFMFPG